MKINIINYNGYLIDSIKWEIEEDFSELVEIRIPLTKTTAEEIMKMNISDYSKILLSAVAGAVIQHVIDCHSDFNFGDMYMYMSFVKE